MFVAIFTRRDEGPSIWGCCGIAPADRQWHTGAARSGPSLRCHRNSSKANEVHHFRRLVLGRMDNYDSEQRRILQHFSKSARFAACCTSLISEILQICVKILLILVEISQTSGKIRKFRRKSCKTSANSNLRLERSFCYYSDVVI